MGGPADSVSGEDSGTVSDARGKYLIPGLGDMQGHTVMPGGRFASRVTEFRQVLLANKTRDGGGTVRVLGDSSRRKRRIL